MKYKGDDEGYKTGALGKFDGPVKLKKGHFPNSVPGTDPRGTGAYTSDDSGLNRATSDDAKWVTEERLTNDAVADIYDIVESNQMGGGGPLKPRGGQS